MEEYPITTIDPDDCFPQLREIPQPPGALSMRGTLERAEGTVLLAVVGSRRYTSYGKNVCESLIAGLAGYPITVVSGLALGIDAIAHRAALDAGLPTIAFPGSGLNWNALYPAQHKGLAEDILASGGALLSEYPDDQIAATWTFPKRNRVIAGLSAMTLIIEAEEKSGTLITARLATEYNKIVGAVPGAVTSPTAKGANWLLKLGAVPVTESCDILRELGMEERCARDVIYLMLNAEEERVFEALTQPMTRDDLSEELGLEPELVSITLSSLEIKGAIRETLGLIERTII